MRGPRLAVALAAVLALAGCPRSATSPDAAGLDTGARDGGPADAITPPPADAALADAAGLDAARADAELTDAELTDATLTDAEPVDATLTDAELADATLTDAESVDAAPIDAELTDAAAPDAEGLDATRTDTTLTDAAPLGPDAAVPDAEGLDATLTDAGGGCPPDAEGCPCAFDPARPAGSCGPGLDCVAWNLAAVAQGAAPIASCLKRCRDDLDCLGGARCGLLRAFGLEVGRVHTLAYCGHGGLGAGEGCAVSLRHGTAIAACGPDLECNVGLFAEPDLGECAHLCTWSAAAPAGDCPGPTPFCNPVFAGSSTAGLGVCAPGRQAPGADCGGLYRLCNDRDFPGSRCFDLPRTDGSTRAACLQTCDGYALDPDLACAALGPGARCEEPSLDAFFCSAGCTPFPDDCGPSARCLEVAAGVSLCAELLGSAATPETAPARIGGGFAFDGPVADCAADPNGCEPGTFCQALVDGVGCVRGCTTGTATTGCRPGTTCAALRSGRPEGLCAR